MDKAGSVFGNKKEDYFTDDFLGFYREDGQKVTEEVLEEWAILLNSPASKIHKKYEISGYSNNENYMFRCGYFVVVNESIFSFMWGYGSTEEEALCECKKRFNYLQEKYNPNNKSERNKIVNTEGGVNLLNSCKSVIQHYFCKQHI